MIQKKFSKAFCNSLSMGGYLKPFDIKGNSQEWLIISRWGDNGELLTVSDTKSEKKADDIKAPKDIEENQTMICVLVQEFENEAYFLMVRKDYDKLTIKGKYYPVDGYCRLYLEDGLLKINAGGRHIHDKEGNDVPYHSGDEKEGMSWIFNAFEVEKES